MADKDQNEKRIAKMMKLSGCKTENQLANLLETNQPQISRWKNTGFPESTANFLDFLFSVIAKQKRELNKLKKEIKALKHTDISNIS